MKYSQKSHSSAGYHNMTVVLFTLLFVLISGSLSLSLKAQPKTSGESVTLNTVPGRNGKIAFTSSRDGNYEIYTMEADGSNQTRLTNNPGYDISPKWSPDGTKIAFLRSIDSLPYDIYVMNADGSNQTRLTNANDRVIVDPPDWSPDGTRIVFSLESDGVGNSFTREIFVVNADGTNQTQVTNSGHNSSPRWSPDGTRIVFDRFGSTVGIYVMNADGSNQTQLTNSPYDYSPRWSPDSSRITFTSFRDEPSPLTCNNCNVEIYSMNADGSNQTRLTNSPGLDDSPEWSPDGTRIVFRSFRGGNSTNIYVMNDDGTSQTRLTNYTELDVVSPIFSPDGTRIMFPYGYLFGGEIIYTQLYVMNADGSNLVSLTNTAAGSYSYEAEPDWQALVSADPNPIDRGDFFIRQQYLDFLEREPEPAGLQFYLDILNGCHPLDTECIKYTRGALSANFFRSPEFGRKGAYVANLFNIVIGQRPKTVAELNDPTKVERPHYAEFMADLATLSTPNDDPLLTDQKKDQLATAWLARTEVQTILPGSLSNQQFVQKLESIAGVTLANENMLIANLNNGSQTRAQVLRAIAESNEVVTKFYIPNFVTMEYLGFLRRDPEDCHISSDPESCGFIFHNRRFNTPGADPDLIENFIVRGFIESPEYRSRFGP